MRLLPLLILLSSTALAEPFEFMLAPTRQDASMDWWYAVPAQFGPKLTLVASVAKGEYFNIVPFFKNYGVASNGEANITYDIAIVRPDGSIDEALENCDGHIGRATPPELIAARAVVRLCFDPEDPYGEYRINVTAYDHVANQTNTQSAAIVQHPFAIVKTTEEEREKLFFQYAVAPDPALALSAFLQTEHSFFNENNEPIWSAIWFFKTIFENNEFLVPHLLAAFPGGTTKQQRDTILVLALMNRTDGLPKLSNELRAFERAMKAGRIPDPYAETTTGQQLDMLWAEFFATGRIAPVEQLATALNLCSLAGTIEKIKAGELDPEHPEVARNGMLEAVFQSALWSLRSNCAQSPLLFQYCTGILDSGKLAKPAEACLAMLLKAIAEETAKKGNP